jgi:hypothetical protein
LPASGFRLPAKHGCVIIAVMRPAMPVVAFTFTWFGIALLILVVMVYQQFTAWDWKGAIVSAASLVALTAVAGGMILLSFVPEQQKTVRLIKIALSHQRKSRA